MSKKEDFRLLDYVKPGDLIAVDWCDASTGRSSMNGGAVDVPMKSWGIFLGVIAGCVQHIILAKNSFSFTETIFDLDYTSIPVGWTVGVKVLVPANVNREIADCMIHSFAKSNSGQPRSSIISSNLLNPHAPRIFMSSNAKGENEDEASLAENLIKRTVTRRRQVRGRTTPEVELPDERLVLGVEFAIAMAICLSFLEVAHMAFWVVG